MVHDQKCELKNSQAYYFRGCGCAQRSLERDPLPPELIPIYPAAPEPRPEVLTSTTWQARQSTPTAGIETWADRQAAMRLPGVV